MSPKQPVGRLERERGWKGREEEEERRRGASPVRPGAPSLPGVPKARYSLRFRGWPATLADAASSR